MTAILTEISPGFVCQTTDRLVSCVHPTGAISPYAKNFNKSILIGAKRYIASVAFTGPAFQDGKPADIFITEQLTGIKCNKGLASFRKRQLLPNKYGGLIHKLRNILGVLRYPKDMAFTLHVAGFRFTKGKKSAFGYSLTKLNDKVHCKPIYSRGQNRIIVGGSAESQEPIVQGLYQITPERFRAPDIKMHAEMIRQISVLNSTVSDKCLFCVLNPSTFPVFMTAFCHGNARQRKTIYTPILIGHDAVHWPAVIDEVVNSYSVGYDSPEDMRPLATFSGTEQLNYGQSSDQSYSIGHKPGYKADGELIRWDLELDDGHWHSLQSLKDRRN